MNTRVRANFSSPTRGGGAERSEAEGGGGASPLRPFGPPPPHVGEESDGA